MILIILILILMMSLRNYIQLPSVPIENPQASDDGSTIPVVKKEQLIECCENNEKISNTFNIAAPKNASIVINVEGCEQLFNPGGLNLMLTTDQNGIMTWINQCSFLGLNNPPINSSTGSEIVLIKNCQFEVLETPTTSSILTSNAGITSWQDITSILPPTIGTVTLVNTGVGLIGGPITSTGTISLANTTVIPGSYVNANITVDAQGRLLAASNGSATGGTVTTINTVGGIQGGPITTTGTISLTTTGVTPNTYTLATITVDANGRITSASNGVALANVTTTNGITVNGVANVPITSSSSLGLDGWEIITGSKILRPQAQSGSATQGRLGDSGHIIFDISLSNLVLYNSALTFNHTIQTSASANYIWITPSGNPTSLTSLLTVTPTGLLNYLTPTSGAQQVLTSTTSGFMAWTNQCAFGGMNNTTVGPLSNAVSGLVVNDTSLAINCLKTLLPGANGSILTVSGGIIQWLPPSSGGSVTLINTGVGLTGGPITSIGTISLANTSVIPGIYTIPTIVVNAQGQITAASNGSAVNSISTTDGILVDGGTGPAFGAVTLSLDGWQIDPISKTLEPIVSGFGSLGNSSHIISNVNINDVILYNSSNTHTIITNATSPYTWTTPTGNPTTLTSLLTVTTSGTLAYSAPSVVNPQVLTANAAGTLTWVDQCAFAGINNTIAGPLANITSGLVVNDTSTAINCLKTLLPGTIGNILTINSSGIIQWLPPAASSGGTVTEIDTGTGLTGGPITTSGTISIANTGVTAGIYTLADIVVNAQGQITTATSGTAVTTISTLDGILVGGGTGPASGAVILSLDGWQINPTGKILEPITTGALGEASHVISSANLNNLILYNSSNTQTIKTSATSNYTWTTPTANPSTTTSLLTVDTTGTVAYNAATSPTQVLVSTTGNAPLWIEQCLFAGINVTITGPLSTT